MQHSSLAAVSTGETSSSTPQLRVVRFDEAEALSTSPSLVRSADHSLAAQEMKFLVSEEVAAQIESRLSSWLQADPHSSESSGYRITTLYCDTDDLAVYHRRGRYGLFKLRLRRYGSSPEIFLERKAKRGTTVRKRRFRMSLEELRRFELPYATYGDDKDWYHWQICRNNFRPAALLEYERSAFFGDCSEGPLRLTFDRAVRGSLTNRWSFDEPAEKRSLLNEQVACEFKYRGLLPSPFKAAVEEFQLIPRGVSKYRRCLEAFHVVADEANHA